MTLNEIIMQLVMLEEHSAMPKGFQPTFQKVIEAISEMPEIIRCKDCKWWDKEDDMLLGYCLAIKHGFYSRNWDISIRRTYPEDFFCADAELRGEEDEWR